MTGWKQFAQTRHGSQLISFFHKLNAEIAEVTASPDKPDGVLLLNTKKGYWLYKVFEREEDVQSVAVFSDRYAQKLIDYSLFQKKLIYLVDDTLIHGNGLFDTYKLLVNKAGNKNEDIQYICPIVFALHEDINPKEKENNAKEKLEQMFWSSLQYYIKMTDQEIGDFCISVTDLLHSAGVPYVIDLPYLKDERCPDSTTNFEVVLTKEQFQELQKNTALWKFRWNSFHVREVNFLQGFVIHMENEPLLSAVQDCFIDFIVTGTYTEDTDGNIHIVFVPFAMAKSASIERIKLLWQVFADIIDIQPDYKLPDKDTDKETANRIWPRPFRECIYLLSMVIAERFKKHLKSLTDISLAYNYDIIEEHFPGNFAQRAQELEKKLSTDPDSIYQKLLLLADSVPADKEMYNFAKVNNFIKDVPEKEKYNQEKAYNIILDVIQEQRKNIFHDKGLTLLEVDDIHRLLTERFFFENKNEERHALSQIIAAFLHSSVFGNRLQVSEDGKMIIKGFRYGENSDLALPFLNLGFYWAVVLTVDNIGKEKMRASYDRFVSNLGRMFEKTGLLGSYISEDDFQNNNKYFKNVIENNLHLYNKSFYFKPFYRGELPESDVKIMYKIEDFVTNTTY